MSRWWRAYDEAATDPKLGLLSDELHRAWFNLMCIASANNGEFPPIKQIAYTLRVKPERAAAILAELHGAGLLDKTEDGFAPHNWKKRQYKADVTDPTAAERMQRYRSNKRNDRNATVTPLRPETDTEADTESEKKEAREPALVDDGWPADFRALFWNDWPHKVGKPKAMNELERLRRRGVAWTDIDEGKRRYIRTKPPDRPWLNPATFLHQERFNDQPAEVTSGKTESLASVAKRQADAGISFGPRPTGLRLVEGGDDVRLLSQAGRERPGDLRGGGDRDPFGISGFGD
jgi:hypothetical protein